MQYLGKGFAIALTAAAATAALYLVVAPSARRATAASTDTVGRVAGKPDFNGIWEANNTANWDIQDHPAQLGVPAGTRVRVHHRDITHE